MKCQDTSLEVIQAFPPRSGCHSKVHDQVYAMMGKQTRAVETGMLTFRVFQKYQDRTGLATLRSQFDDFDFPCRTRNINEHRLLKAAHSLHSSRQASAQTAKDDRGSACMGCCCDLHSNLKHRPDFSLHPGNSIGLSINRLASYREIESKTVRLGQVENPHFLPEAIN